LHPPSMALLPDFLSGNPDDPRWSFFGYFSLPFPPLLIDTDEVPFLFLIQAFLFIHLLPNDRFDAVVSQGERSSRFLRKPIWFPPKPES